MAGSVLRDWEDIDVPLVLTIRGKQYRVPPLSASVGALVALVHSDDEATSKDATERLNGEWFRNMLGAVYDTMQADEVPYKALERAATTALVDHQHGRVAAIAMWETGALDPEALAAFMAATKVISEIP